MFTKLSDWQNNSFWRTDRARPYLDIRWGHGQYEKWELSHSKISVEYNVPFENNGFIKQNAIKMTTENIVLIMTAIATALISGLFYAYSCSVNLGLRNLPDAGYVAAMQSINKAILNPLFFASFIGALILLPLSAYLHYNQSSPRFLALLISAILYMTGVFGVTVFGNVPLNEALARFDLSSASVEEITRQREGFEAPWNKLHSVRTIASIVSLVLVIFACMSESIFAEDADGTF